MKAVIIIPVRLESQRLHNKALLSETGKPLIQHTWENCKDIAETYIATDNEEIKVVSSSFGASVIMTSHCTCGTQRVYEASKHLNADLIINVQGDNPNIKPDAIEQMIEKLPEYPVMSMCYKNPENNPNQVKVMLDYQNNSVWQSRHEYIHIGTYGFQKWFLEKYVTLKDSENGIRENLEQLRILDNNHKIHMIITDACHSIDTRNDYDSFKTYLAMVGKDG